MRYVSEESRIGERDIAFRAGGEAADTSSGEPKFNPEGSTLYEKIGVDMSADEQTIKNRVRLLIRTSGAHPDSSFAESGNAQGTELLTELIAIRDTLTNSERRLAYNNSLMAERESPAGAAGGLKIDREAMLAILEKYKQSMGEQIPGVFRGRAKAMGNALVEKFGYSSAWIIDPETKERVSDEYSDIYLEGSTLIAEKDRECWVINEQGEKLSRGYQGEINDLGGGYLVAGWEHSSQKYIINSKGEELAGPIRYSIKQQDGKFYESMLGEMSDKKEIKLKE